MPEGQEEEAKKVHSLLLQEGISVGLIHLKGNSRLTGIGCQTGYQIDGIRFAITPKVEPAYQMADALRAVKIVAKVYQSCQSVTPSQLV